jgi:hypothetical protein
MTQESSVLDSVSTNEETLHAETISALAEETGQPFPVVKEIFDQEYVRRKEMARLADYLVLFATRRTKDALKRRSSFC